MSRGLPTPFVTELQAQVVRPALFYEGEFATGFLRLWTGMGEIVWGGQTWIGGREFLSIGAVDEVMDVVASGTSVTLSGLPQETVQISIDEAQQNAPGRIWLGLLNGWDAVAGGSPRLVADPVLLFAGRLNVPTIVDDPASGRCDVEITYESRLIDLTTARELRYTHESQQLLYPGDRAFEFVAAIQDREITWGRKS